MERQHRPDTHTPNIDILLYNDVKGIWVRAELLAMYSCYKYTGWVKRQHRTDEGLCSAVAEVHF